MIIKNTKQQITKLYRDERKETKLIMLNYNYTRKKNSINLCTTAYHIQRPATE